MKVLVIIPAYNERGSIEKTVTDIMQNAPELDYLVVNDCSKDDTKEICERNGYHLLNLPINLGIGGGVQSGYLYAKRNGYDYAVQFDGDGQHNASYLNQMVKTMEKKKLDMLIGSRFIENEGFQSSFMRRVGIRYFMRLIKLVTGKTITDPTSGMRMVNREVIGFFAENYPKDYPEPESVVTLLKMGKNVEEIPVIMNEREEGTSSISMRNSVYYMIKVSLAIVMAALGSGNKK
ncbi:MAG: glycosyltransferase family 2 protein [Eubacterium sp.]|nr:glycosyltransferase family 2 protein [Eubacterium sp.]